MINKEFAEKMRNDQELQELRKEVYAITGNLGDISFCLGKDTLEGFKERLRERVRQHEAISQ